MQRLVLALSLLILAACATTPMRWEQPGVADGGGDEAQCRAQAQREAAQRLPYGNGPPIFIYRETSMLQWTQAIDNERGYLAEDLTKACMSERGYTLVPDSR